MQDWIKSLSSTSVKSQTIVYRDKILFTVFVMTHFYSILHNWSYVNLSSVNVHMLVFVQVHLQSNGNAVSHPVSINLKIASKDAQSWKETIYFACKHNLWAQTPDELIRFFSFFFLFVGCVLFLYLYLFK